MVDYHPSQSAPASGAATLKQRLQQGRQALKQRPGLIWLIAIVLALLISWAPWYLGGDGYFPLGLSLAGLIMVVMVDGWRGLGGLLKRSGRLRASWRWYAVAVLLPAGLAVAGLGLHVLVGGGGYTLFSAPLFQSRLWLSLLMYTVVAILNPLAGPVGQEVLGLRGYALPKLHAQVGALWASLIIGSFWGLWHLPEFFDPNAPQSALGWAFFLPFVVLEIAISMIVTWVYNRTRESVLVSAILMNIAFNFWWAALLSQAPADSRREFPPLDPQAFGWTIALTVLAAAIVLVLTHGRLGEEVEGTGTSEPATVAAQPPTIIPSVPSPRTPPPDGPEGRAGPEGASAHDHAPTSPQQRQEVASASAAEATSDTRPPE
jgi:membrane protease YdiL (CAAX protease family)